ncbi:MAG: helix-turn-helix transcriptional regulator [Planctomycetes bacterium]|nr:helix-turn-helix transcriptional regulator [Planctomycetota bacterium]MBI3833480.1 helix-turn-helix transcriptional regulator [Planctomycetota bacterium]
MPTKPQHAKRYAQIPGFLRALREEAGLTQRQLAERMRQPQSWVHKSETGLRRVDVAEFCDWCQACGVKAESGIRRFLAD